MERVKAIVWNAAQGRLRAGWRMIAQLAITALLYWIATTAFSWLEGALKDSALWASLAVRVATNLVRVSLTSLCILVSLLLAGRFLDRRPFKAFGFALDRGWWADLGFGMALGAVLMGGVFAVERLAGWVTITGSFQTNASTFGVGLLLYAVLFINVSLQEEVMTRGYWLRNLAEGLNFRRLGPKGALLISYGLTSALFGLMHLGNQNATLVSTLNLVLAGLFLGLPYVLTGELAISLGLHLTWNFFQGNVFGFPVSGGASGTSYLVLQQGGPALWTGGAFGPEAGLIGVIAMLMGAGLVALWVKYTRGRLSWHRALAAYSGATPPSPQTLLTEEEG